MELLYKDRDIETQNFIQEVCNDIISQPLEKKENSDDFCAVFVEGRDRGVCLEDIASIHSFKVFSQKDYPVYLFCRNINDWKASELSKFSNIQFQECPAINSLEEYTDFYIKHLFFLLPYNVEKLLTLQPDAMLLKPGWEDFILTSNYDWISPHWKHYAQVDLNINDKWYVFTKKTCIGGGGFSFRKKSVIIELSKSFSSFLPKLREYGREDNRIPMEDLFFCSLLNTYPNFRMPTLKQCDDFAIDPLTKERWNNKETLPYGFHFFKPVSEFSPCSHE